MCLCRQDPIHTYDTGRALLRNVTDHFFLTQKQRAWSSAPDCPCSDTYLGAALFPIPDGATLTLGLLMAACLLLAPLVLGLNWDRSRKIAISAVVVWSAIVLSAFGADFAYHADTITRFPQHAFKYDAGRHALNAVIQFAFNLVATLILPALPIVALVRLRKRDSLRGTG